MPRNYTIMLVLILIVGIVVGGVGMWVYGLTQDVKPRVIEGYSSGTNYAGTAIGISQEVGGGGDGYSIEGTTWREFGGPWNQGGSPPSLSNTSYGQKIRMGVIDYAPTKYAPGSSVVAWLEVLDTKNIVTVK